MSESLVDGVFRLLADGCRYAPGDLERRLGVSPDRLRAAIDALADMGLEIESRHDTVRLTRPVPALAPATIERLLPAGVLERLDGVEVVFSTSSTNEVLSDARHDFACLLAEHQRNGRGRAGRSWQSPLGASIYLSVKYTFKPGVPPSGCLSLGVGQALAARLRTMGPAAGVKWPNDIFVRQRKLAGILIESRMTNPGCWAVVVGVGLNYALPEAVRDDPALGATDFRDSGGDPAVDRNTLAAAAIEAIFEACDEFAQFGPTPIVERWPAWDAFPGATVRFNLSGEREDSGEAVGIDGDGRLLVGTAAGTRALAAGDVSYQVLAHAGNRRG